MRYYPVVGTVHYKDKTITLKLDFMAKYIEKKMARCTNPACSYLILYSSALRRAAGIVQSIIRGMETAGKWRLRGLSTEVQTEKKVQCVRCGWQTDAVLQKCIKLYTYVDPRIDVGWDLFHGLIQYTWHRQGVDAHGVLLLRKSGFRKYYRQRQELYVIIDSYDDFKNIVGHLHIKNEQQGPGWPRRKAKYAATWELKKIPTGEELETAFTKYKLRKLADAI